MAAFSRVPRAKAGGVDRDRTDDLKLAKLALSQLSYDPVLGKSAGLPSRSLRSKRRLVGPGGVEPPTSRLSGVRSNHLSYEPVSKRQGSGIRDQVSEKPLIDLGAHTPKAQISKAKHQAPNGKPRLIPNTWPLISAKPGKDMWTAEKQCRDPTAGVSQQPCGSGLVSK